MSLCTISILEKLISVFAKRHTFVKAGKNRDTDISMSAVNNVIKNIKSVQNTDGFITTSLDISGKV